MQKLSIPKPMGSNVTFNFTDAKTGLIDLTRQQTVHIYEILESVFEISRPAGTL